MPENKEIIVESDLVVIDAPVSLPDRLRNLDDFKVVALKAQGFLQHKMGMPESEVLKELGFAVQIAQKNASLQTCTPRSVFNAIANIGQMGLTLNPAMKFAYLVPRRNKGEMECCLSPSYMGLIKLCTDPGGVVAITGGCVFEGDIYEVDPAMETLKVDAMALRPRSKLETTEIQRLDDRHKTPTAFWDQLIFAYSVAKLHNGAISIDLIEKERLLKIKKLFVKSIKEDSVVNRHPSEWCRKTVIAHHTKTLPKSEHAAAAVDLFHRAEGGVNYDNLPEHSDRSIHSQLQREQITTEQTETVYAADDDGRKFD